MKRMKKIVGLIFALMLAIALTGCATDSEKLVGKWSGKIDVTDLVSDSVAESGYGDYFEFDDMYIVLNTTFNKDGTYSSEIDEASVQNVVDELISAVEDGMYDMLEAEISASGMDMSVEDLLAFTGLSMDDIIAELKAMLEEEDIVGQMLDGSNAEGKYDAKEGKLFLSAGLDYEIDENVYEVYELDGDTLTISESVGSDDESVLDMAEDLYPLIMTKVD